MRALVVYTLAILVGAMKQESKAILQLAMGNTKPQLPDSSTVARQMAK